VPEDPPARPADFVSRSSNLETGQGWPRWALYAVLALVVVAAVVAVVAAAITART
jgi:hypothetical protein